MSPEFPRSILTKEDDDLLVRLLGSGRRVWKPDFVIAPYDRPYLYRWYIVPRNKVGNVYLHVQVGSDPERPLHDHPWDNMTVILSGGYDELWAPAGNHSPFGTRTLRKGGVEQRPADQLHRLILPDGIPYTITLFTTGPAIRDWGFQYKSGWQSHSKHIETRDGVSVVKQERRA